MSIVKHPSAVIIDGHPTMYSDGESLPTTTTNEKVAIDGHIQDGLVECFVVPWKVGSLAVIKNDEITLINKGDQQVLSESLGGIAAALYTMEKKFIGIYHVDSNTAQALKYTLDDETVDIDDEKNKYIFQKSKLINIKNDNNEGAYGLDTSKRDLEKIMFANKPLTDFGVNLDRGEIFFKKNHKVIYSNIIDPNNPFEIHSKQRNDEPLIVEITDKKLKKAWNEDFESMGYFYVDQEYGHKIKRLKHEGEEVHIDDVHDYLDLVSIQTDDNYPDWKKLDQKNNTLSSFTMDDEEVRVGNFIEDNSTRARMRDKYGNQLGYIDTENPHRIKMDGEYMHVTPYGNGYYYITPIDGECLGLGLIDFSTHTVRSYQGMLITSFYKDDETFTVKSKSGKRVDVSMDKLQTLQQKTQA